MKNIGKLAVLGAVLAASSSFALADSIEFASYSTTGAVTATGGATITGVTHYTGANVVQTYNGDFQGSPAPNQTPTLTNPTGTSFNLGATPSSWAPALTSPVQSYWTGAFATAAPGGTSVAQGFYTYQTSFTAVGGVYNGSLTVLADDTVETILDYGTADAVVLNGFSALRYDQLCADNAPNCTVTFTDTLTNINLLAGVNTLTFIVEQAGNVAQGDPSGVDFAG